MNHGPPAGSGVFFSPPSLFTVLAGTVLQRPRAGRLLLPRRPLLQAALAVWHWAVGTALLASSGYGPVASTSGVEPGAVARGGGGGAHHNGTMAGSDGNRILRTSERYSRHLHACTCTCTVEMRRERYGYPRAYASQARHGLPGYRPTGLCYYCTTLLAGSGCAFAPHLEPHGSGSGMVVRPRGSRSGAVDDELMHALE